MKSALLCALLSLALVSTTRAVDTPGPFPHVYAREFKMGTYRAKGYTRAQKLVDSLPKRFMEIEYGLIHAELIGGGGEHDVIASHRPAQVGALDPLDDNKVSDGDDSGIHVNPREREGFSRTVVSIPMKDASGKFIHASWVFYFYTYHTDDLAAVKARAIQIRDELAKDIPSLESLYEPAASRS